MTLKLQSSPPPLNIWENIVHDDPLDRRSEKLKFSEKAGLIALYMIASVTSILLIVDWALIKPIKSSTRKIAAASTIQSFYKKCKEKANVRLQILNKLKVQIINGSKFEIISSNEPDQELYDTIKKWQVTAEKESQKEYRAYLLKNKDSYNIRPHGFWVTYIAKEGKSLLSLVEYKDGQISLDYRPHNTLLPYSAVALDVIQHFEMYVNPTCYRSDDKPTSQTILISKHNGEIVALALVINDRWGGKNVLEAIVKNPSTSVKYAGESIIRYLACRTILDQKKLTLMAVREACSYYDKYGFESRYRELAMRCNLTQFELTVQKARYTSANHLRPFNWPQQVA